MEIPKQDRQGARTVSDLQRRYNSKFSEVMGLSQEALNSAMEVERQLEDVWAKDITMTGSFTSTGEGYLPTTWDDATKILNAVLFPDVYMPEDPTLYDLNKDGFLTEDDAFLALAVANGERSMESLPGAVLRPVTITIDMSDPVKAVKITGTNQFGTVVETSVGVDPASCSFAAKAYIDRLLRIDEETGSIWRECDGATEWLNPPMVVDQEYRTYERWNGSPVYRKLIRYVFDDVHTSVKNAVPHGITNLDKILKVESHTANRVFPYVWGGTSTAVTDYDETNLSLGVTALNWDTAREWFFEMWYTKMEEET